jgi:hypothetical protein
MHKAIASAALAVPVLVTGLLFSIAQSPPAMSIKRSIAPT